MIDTQALASFLSAHLNQDCKIIKTESLSGGSIHQATALYTQDDVFFVKWNKQKMKPVFEAEKEGLLKLKDAGVPVPELIDLGETDTHAFLMMAFVESTEPARHYWVNFGALVASLHKNENETYGAQKDNYIGRLFQDNTPQTDWVTFFGEQRLEPMIKRAVKDQKLPISTQRRFLKLFDKLSELMPIEPPSLLHGDLWSGNVLCNKEGLPTLIDPAVYYGHREMDIAFTQLFGRFPTSFYRAYQKEYPLQDGWEERVHLHNLYPLLVHLNLFGEEYLSQIRQALMYFV